MKTLSRIALLLLLVPLSLFASLESHEFDNPAQEAQYIQQNKEHRSLVCQNQNLADSNAELAKDLREKAYEMVKQGKTHDQITDYMIARYGDFVMYRPPMKTSTYLLWLGPFVFLLIALLVLIFFIRKKSSNDDAPTADEIKAARQHLDT
jgi:cytochrome c-type biogenesis protein CcmH